MAHSCSVAVCPLGPFRAVFAAEDVLRVWDVRVAKGSPEKPVDLARLLGVKLDLPLRERMRVDIRTPKGPRTFMVGASLSIVERDASSFRPLSPFLLGLSGLTAIDRVVIDQDGYGFVLNAARIDATICEQYLAEGAECSVDCDSST